MASDISRNVVAVLLVLTIAVSAVGTYAVANSQAQVDAQPSNGAEVSLDIEANPPVSEVSLVIAEQQNNEENI